MKNDQLCQCPVCTYEGNSNLFTYGWVVRLKELVYRNPGLGFNGDLGDMDLEELHGLYLNLNKDSQLGAE